jgi:hypothetical protein
MGITSANDSVLYFYDPLFGIRVVAREGDPAIIGGFNLGVVADNGIFTYMQRAGSLNSFNDQGIFAYSLQLTNGSTLIATVSIPEPACICFALQAAAFAVLLRRRARQVNPLSVKPL